MDGPDSIAHFPDIQRKSCLEPFPAPGNSACPGPAAGLQAAGGNAGEVLRQRPLLTERNPKSHDNPNALPGLAVDGEGGELGVAGRGLAHAYRL